MRPGFRSQLWHLVAVWPWVRNFTYSFVPWFLYLKNRDESSFPGWWRQWTQDFKHSSQHARWPHDLFSSVQFSHSVVSNSLWPHGLQHARPPCPSPTPGVYASSCPLSRWCHPTILSSVAPSTPVLNISQSQDFFKWVSSSHQVAKSIGASAIASVFPIYIQNWFHLGLTGLISLWSKELSRVFPNSKTSILVCCTLFMVQLSHLYMTAG